VFLKLFGMNEATLMRGPPDGGKRSAPPTTRCTALVPMSVTPLYAAIIGCTVYQIVRGRGDVIRRREQCFNFSHFKPVFCVEMQPMSNSLL
jgi:hypothetical protein